MQRHLNLKQRFSYDVSAAKVSWVENVMKLHYNIIKRYAQILCNAQCAFTLFMKAFQLVSSKAISCGS